MNSFASLPITGATLRQHRRSLVSWVLGLSAFGATMLALYPSVKGNQDFAKLLESYPAALQKLFALSDYTSPTGYLRAEVFSFLAPLLVSLFAVFLGADLVAGEEGRGALESVMVTPVTRRRLYGEQLLALMIMVSTLAFALGLVLGFGGVMVHLTISPLHLFAATLALALLAIVLGALSLAVGAATGRRGVALSLGAVVLVGSYLLSQLATLVPLLMHVRGLSPWWHTLGVDPLTVGVAPWHLGLVIASGLFASWLGVWLFNRRDIGI